MFFFHIGIEACGKRMIMNDSFLGYNFSEIVFDIEMEEIKLCRHVLL